MKTTNIVFTFLWPTVVWVVVTMMGFGSQSLVNLVELLAVWLMSLVLVLIPGKMLNFKHKLIISTVFVILLRALVPLIPE